MRERGRKSGDLPMSGCQGKFVRIFRARWPWRSSFFCRRRPFRRFHLRLLPIPLCRFPHPSPVRISDSLPRRNSTITFRSTGRSSEKYPRRNTCGGPRSFGTGRRAGRSSRRSARMESSPASTGRAGLSSPVTRMPPSAPFSSRTTGKATFDAKHDAIRIDKP